MALNAAGLEVRGASNPNWKGGLLPKICAVCSKPYSVKRVHAKSRFCSLQCVGVSQKGRLVCHGGTRTPRPSTKVRLICVECAEPFAAYRAHAHRYQCCSRTCSHKQRGKRQAGSGNPNWCGGLSRLPYPWNFREISQRIIERDHAECQNPACAGTDPRLTAHHINYVKADCRPINLIALCSSCNSKANFGRARWQAFYAQIMTAKKNGGGYDVEQF